MLLHTQAQEWIDVAVFAEEGALSTGRLLLEEAQGWQDNEGGSHETQSTRHWGECGWVGVWMDGWMACHNKNNNNLSATLENEKWQIRDHFQRQYYCILIYSNECSFLFTFPVRGLFFCTVHLRLLCALGHSAHFPSQVLLVVAGEWLTDWLGEGKTERQGPPTKHISCHMTMSLPIFLMPIFIVAVVCRILTLCWCTIWTCRIRMITKWQLSHRVWRCGATKKSGRKRN